MSQYFIFAILVFLALSFNFLNGFNDAATVAATIIASRALSPRAALLMAAAGNLLGPLLFGVAVATTIGRDIVDPSSVTMTVIVGRPAGGLHLGPHHLVAWHSFQFITCFGGRIGGGRHCLWWSCRTQARWLDQGGASLVFSPILGFLVGWVSLRLILLLAQGATPRINKTFNRLQLITGTALALSHGANDAQKAMGVIAMGLVTLGYQASFHVPLWVILTSSAAIGIGTAAGGWRIIRTLGGKFYRIRPVHSLASQFSAASVIFGASLLGGPVSTTHVVSSAVVGVGASQRLSQVRWTNLADIGIAWLITVPITMALAVLFYLALRPVLGP